MELLKDNNGNHYIDQPLFNHLNNMWLTYDQKIPNYSNIFFMKNVTTPRVVTDYLNTGISRVIKKEKASHCIINKISIDNYPRYFDRALNVRTDDDTKEVVYSLNRIKPEEIDTIKQIIDFHTRGQKIDYVNQNILNESLNNGFIIDNDNYTILKELIDSEYSDNHNLACSMLINSDLEKNFEWILYLYHDQAVKITKYDLKSVVFNFVNSKYNIHLKTLLDSFDKTIKVVKNEDVRDKLVQYKKSEFYSHISTYFDSHLYTNMFDLIDFEIKLKEIHE